MEYLMKLWSYIDWFIFIIMAGQNIKVTFWSQAFKRKLIKIILNKIQVLHKQLNTCMSVSYPQQYMRNLVWKVRTLFT